MKKVKQSENQNRGQDRWLISYADFITLLMVFFMMMYSMSSIDAKKFNQLSNSLNIALEGGTGILDGHLGIDEPAILSVAPGIQPSPGPAYPVPTTQAVSRVPAVVAPSAVPAVPEEFPTRYVLEQQRLLQLRDNLQALLLAQGLTTEISLHLDERGLVISLSDNVLFDSGEATIRDEFVPKLTLVGNIIRDLENYIRVEGHTDNAPIRTGRFGSNWELSVLRATNVVEFFISANEIPPDQLIAVGYSEYRPVADNLTEENKAKNRRVDIIIVSSQYNALEEQAMQETTE